LAAPRPPRRAFAALLLVTLIWGWTFVWMDQALEAVRRASGAAAEPAGIAWFMSLRFGLATVLMLLLPGVRRRAPGLPAGSLLLGGPLVAGFFLQMYGLREVSPAVSAFLTSLYVVFTALLGALLGRRSGSVFLLAGVLLATLGSAFIGGPPQVHFGFAELLTVGSAFVFAVHILLTDAVTRRLPVLPVTAGSFAVVTLGSLAALGIESRRPESPGAEEWLAWLREPDFLLPLLASSILATVLALSLMNRFQKELPPVRAAVLYAIEPVWAALIGLALGRQEVDLWLVAGGSALLAGNLLADHGARLAWLLRAPWRQRART